MNVMFCRNRVEDFAKWKAVFDSHAEAHADAGLRLLYLWRETDDPSNVFFVFEVADIGRAVAFINAPGAAAVGERSGVLEGEFHFLESA